MRCANEPQSRKSPLPDAGFVCGGTSSQYSASLSAFRTRRTASAHHIRFIPSDHSPAGGTVATFSFTEGRHIPLAARRQCYTNSMGSTTHSLDSHSLDSHSLNSHSLNSHSLNSHSLDSLGSTPMSSISTGSIWRTSQLNRGMSAFGGRGDMSPDLEQFSCRQLIPVMTGNIIGGSAASIVK